VRQVPLRPEVSTPAAAPVVGADRRALRTRLATDLPSDIPSFLEACGKLAGEAVSRGDLVQAKEILERAVRAVAPSSHVAPTRV